MSTSLERADSVARFVDEADALVPEDPTGGNARHIAFEDV
jgi:hypothetical protein